MDSDHRCLRGNRVNCALRLHVTQSDASIVLQVKTLELRVALLYFVTPVEAALPGFGWPFLSQACSAPQQVLSGTKPKRNKQGGFLGRAKAQLRSLRVTRSSVTSDILR